MMFRKKVDRLWDLENPRRCDEFCPVVLCRSFSTSYNLWVEVVTDVSLEERRDWTDQLNISVEEVAEHIIPSSQFIEAFKNIPKTIHISTSTSFRAFIDLFLMQIVLLPEFNNSLRIYTELKVVVEKTYSKEIVRMEGVLDYAIGLADENYLRFVVCERKEDNSIMECIAQTAALYKLNRDAARENCEAWGVFVKEGSTWEFVHVDKRGVVWQGPSLTYDLPHFSVKDIVPVYRALYCIIRQCFEKSSYDCKDLICPHT